jgi:hypothetical protein
MTHVPYDLPAGPMWPEDERTAAELRVRLKRARRTARTTYLRAERADGSYDVLEVVESKVLAGVSGETAERIVAALEADKSGDLTIALREHTREVLGEQV